MLIEQAIMTKLLATTAITDLVGQRIYFTRAAQDTAKPYLVITKISDIPHYCHDGPAGISDARIQFSAFAETYQAVKNLNAAIRTAFEGFTGLMGGSSGVYIGKCFKDLEADFYEDDTRLFNSPVDYLITYNE